jgi:hypothetical protein
MIVFGRIFGGIWTERFPLPQKNLMKIQLNRKGHWSAHVLENPVTSLKWSSIGCTTCSKMVSHSQTDGQEPNYTNKWKLSANQLKTVTLTLKLVTNIVNLVPKYNMFLVSFKFFYKTTFEKLSLSWMFLGRNCFRNNRIGLVFMTTRDEVQWKMKRRLNFML